METTRMMKTILLPYFTLHPPLPDIPDAISTSPDQPSDSSQRVTPPAPVFPVDHATDDAAIQPSCHKDPALETALTSPEPPPPGLRRSSRIRRPPARFVDYDTEP